MKDTKSIWWRKYYGRTLLLVFLMLENLAEYHTLFSPIIRLNLAPLFSFPLQNLD